MHGQGEKQPQTRGADRLRSGAGAIPQGHSAGAPGTQTQGIRNKAYRTSVGVPKIPARLG